MPVKSIAYKDVLTYHTNEGNSAPPTDVKKFLSHLFKVLTHAFQGEESTKPLITYLNHLYLYAVFDGKNFRDKIPKGEAIIDDEEEAEEEQTQSIGNVIPGVDNAFEFQLPGNIILCLVVRGSEKESVRSQIHKVKDTAGEEREVAILSYKLFQACVSLLCAMAGNFKELPSAQLGANVVRACLIKDAAPDKDHWGLHGHAGLNFVAKYIYQSQKTDTAAEMKSKHLPPFHACVFLAYRMDQQRIASVKNPAEKGKKKKDEEYTTVRAIFQATQLSEVEQKALLDRLKKESKNWGSSFTGAAQAAANYLVSELKKAEKGLNEKEVSSEAPEVTVTESFSRIKI